MQSKYDFKVLIKTDQGLRDAKAVKNGEVPGNPEQAEALINLVNQIIYSSQLLIERSARNLNGSPASLDVVNNALLQAIGQVDWEYLNEIGGYSIRLSQSLLGDDTNLFFTKEGIKVREVSSANKMTEKAFAYANEVLGFSQLPSYPSSNDTVDITIPQLFSLLARKNFNEYKVGTHKTYYRDPRDFKKITDEWNEVLSAIRDEISGKIGEGLLAERSLDSHIAALPQHGGAALIDAVAVLAKDYGRVIDKLQGVLPESEPGSDARARLEEGQKLFADGLARALSDNPELGDKVAALLEQRVASVNKGKS